MRYVAVQSAELGVLQAVAAHLCVLVVDGVEENEDGRDYEHRGGHEAGYEGQVVHWGGRDEKHKSGREFNRFLSYIRRRVD